MSLIRPIGLLGIVAFFAFAPIAFAANRPATADDCKKIATLAPGIPCEVGKTPYDPDQPFIGDEVAAATKFLLERNGSGSRGSECYNGDQTLRITKLNPQFRVNLYKALTEMEKELGGKNIIQSGFRCDGTGGNHERGCAADIIWTSCSRMYPGNTERAWRCSSDHYDKATDTWSQPEQKWIDANGKKYGIHLRLRYGPEGHHVEPMNTNGCVTGSVTSGPGSPSGNLTDAIRQYLMPQPALPPQPMIPPQPIPTSQPIIEAFKEPIAATTSTSSPRIDGTTPTSTSSIADKLAALIEDKQVTTGTTTFPVTIDGKDIATIQASKKAQQVPDSPGVGGSIAQNSFSTSDLSSGASNADQEDLTGFAKILAAIKMMLLKLLAALVPFDAQSHSDALHPEPEYDY